ncbi:MAG: hypothetical protein WCP29_11375 [Acidobacteriota bacterium]
MRSRSLAWRWLLAKEWRDLVASRSWWLLLGAMGPLVGVSFISAVHTYAEASGLNGTTAGVGEAFAPLVGIWAPTFSACELAAAFLLPFVAIRLVAGDRLNGVLTIESQQGCWSITRLGTKALVLGAGWLVASLAPLLAVALWSSYGGVVYPPELVSVMVGHLLNAGLTISLAAAASSVARHPSTAAILTLGVTVGTWILNFIAAVQGGWWERAAGFTPTAMVDQFQHGLVRLDATLVAVVLIASGLGLAAIWFRTGMSERRRAAESVALGLVGVVAVLLASLSTLSWDLSEARANSFPVVDETAIRSITAPLRIEVHLAPEDPRRVDLDRRALRKLKRVLPSVDVRYISATSIGLFEQTNPQYGEIWYDLGGRRAMSRVTTADGVLEAIYDLARITPPAESDEALFRGHPLAVPPRGANWVFYGLWPVAVVAAGWFVHRRRV